MKMTVGWRTLDVGEKVQCRSIHQSFVRPNSFCGIMANLALLVLPGFLKETTDKGKQWCSADKGHDMPGMGCSSVGMNISAHVKDPVVFDRVREISLCKY